MKNWIERDLEHNWHPYTQMKDCESLKPILIEKASGMKLYGPGGNYYYDTISSWWCNVHGHNHPRIRRAICDQIKKLDHIMFAGFTHKPAIRLAEALVSIAPGDLSRVFFSDDGSTAVETALKLSFQYWHNTGRPGKRRFVSLDRGYHGDTIGAMSVSSIGLFNSLFTPLMFRSIRVPSPYCYRCPSGKSRNSCRVDCIRPLEKVLRERHEEIAALILEPIVMAAGGMIIYPPEYLERAAKLARRYGVHLIVDEVATGFGRTGRMFACEHARGAEPDLMCLSKGITSGTLPLGVTLATDRIYRAFYGDYEKRKTFYHGHTYTANPISCSAALASLGIFEDEGVLDKVKVTAAMLRDGLQRFKGLKLAGDVRGIGMIGAIELVKDRHSKKPFGIGERVGLSIFRSGLDKGLVLRPLGNIIYLYLPLCIRKRELSYVLDKTYEAIGAAEGAD